MVYKVYVHRNLLYDSCCLEDKLQPVVVIIGQDKYPNNLTNIGFLY